MKHKNMVPKNKKMYYIIVLLFAEKSFDLKYVIQQMMDPDPRSRPTVDQLMAFPCVRKVWKRRVREYMIKNAVRI